MSAAWMAVVVVVAAAAEPVGVMPWRDLSDERGLAWLSAGMQETMGVDLQKAGVVVVERGRIDAALRELSAATPPAPGAPEVLRAVQAGRLIGARTLVVGSFQKSGPELRLVARFVDVETGEVKGAATATGPLSRVFALQDEVIAKLLGRPQRVRPAKKKQPSSSSSSSPPLLAYQRFSESLTATRSEGERLLRESLALDPELSYAHDALAALTTRIDTALHASARAVLERSAQRMQVAHDVAAVVDVRVAAAAEALAMLRRGRCFHALLAACETILGAPVLSAVAEDASAARVLALARLRRLDLALQAGEKHLVAFAGGASVDDVTGLVRGVVEEQRTLPARRAEFLAELQEGGDAFRPCIAAKWSLLPQEMGARCSRFLKEAGPDVDVDHRRSARAYVAWSFALRGQFDEAWRRALELEAADPGALDDSGLRAVMDDKWSTDR